MWQLAFVISQMHRQTHESIWIIACNESLISADIYGIVIHYYTDSIMINLFPHTVSSVLFIFLLIVF